MKIFGWMHHKIHLSRSYSILSHENVVLAENLKKAEAITLEKDTHALLISNNHDALLVDNLHGWDNSILAIGTFGLQLHQPDHVIYSDQVLEEVQDMKEEEEKVVHVEFSIKDDGEHHQLPSPLKKQLMVGIESPKSQHAIDSRDLEDENKKNGRRVTLADLFYAEAKPNSVAGKAQILCEALPVSMEKVKEQKKKQRPGKSLAKKLMPWKGEDANHTPKLQKLITKMLKKKIHPDFGADLNGGCGSEIKVNTKLSEGNESELLLRDTAITA